MTDIRKPSNGLLQDLTDGIAVLIDVHGLPAVEWATARLRKQLEKNPDQPLVPPKRERSPVAEFGGPPYPQPRQKEN